jgi:hypothetical protein
VEQSPEVETQARGGGGNIVSGSAANGERAGEATAKVGAAAREGKPLKGKPWTWLWGEINPRGLVGSRKVEDR